MNLLKFFLLLLVISPALSRRVEHQIESKYVYGARQKVEDESSLPEVLKPAAAAAGILIADGWGYESEIRGFNVSFKLLERGDKIRPNGHASGNWLPVCEDDGDRSSILTTRSFCSGFAVSPNLFVLAGHCFTGYIGTAATLQSFCYHTVVMFDWRKTTNERRWQVVDHDRMYNCKKVISARFAAEQGRGGQYQPDFDYAVIQLDRDVDFPNFKFAPVQDPSNSFFADRTLVGKGVVTVGYPNGLNELMDKDGLITSIQVIDRTIEATLDAEKGSSGSIVVSNTTGKVYGILVKAALGWERRVMENTGGQYCYYREHHRCRGQECLNARFSSTVTTTDQFWRHIDHNPIHFPVLSKDDANSVRTKALQLLVGYTSPNGRWTRAFSNFLKSHLSRQFTFNRDPMSALYPEDYDGSYISRPILSTLLREIGESACGRRGTDCPRKIIKVARYLFKEGHSGYDYVSNRSTFDTTLANAIRAFSESKGYTPTTELDIKLWRHLFTTEI